MRKSIKTSRRTKPLTAESRTIAVSVSSSRLLVISWTSYYPSSPLMSLGTKVICEMLSAGPEKNFRTSASAATGYTQNNDSNTANARILQFGVVRYTFMRCSIGVISRDPSRRHSRYFKTIPPQPSYPPYRREPSYQW